MPGSSKIFRVSYVVCTVRSERRASVSKADLRRLLRQAVKVRHVQHVQEGVLESPDLCAARFACWLAFRLVLCVV